MKTLMSYALLALIFSWACGIGTYVLAPSGAYTDWTMQGASHDWHQYQWFFQTPLSAWFILVCFGILVGSLIAIFAVPTACAVCALLFWRRLVLQERFSLANPARLVSLAITLGLAVGIVVTIVAGRNPGIP